MTGRVPDGHRVRPALLCEVAVLRYVARVGDPLGLAFHVRVAGARLAGGLSAFTGDRGTVLMWSEGSDAETPSGGLSYNLRVVDTGSGFDVFPAMGAATGWRRVPSIGPVRPGPSYAWHALTLPGGDYEFRVQAIDSSLDGGPWSEPELFTVP